MEHLFWCAIPTKFYCVPLFSGTKVGISMMKNIFLLCWLAELYFHFLSDDRKCERRLQISLVTSFLSSPRSSLPESQFFLFFPSYQRKSLCLQSTTLVPKVLPTDHCYDPPAILCEVDLDPYIFGSSFLLNCFLCCVVFVLARTKLK